MKTIAAVLSFLFLVVFVVVCHTIGVWTYEETHPLGAIFLGLMLIFAFCMVVVLFCIIWWGAYCLVLDAIKLVRAYCHFRRKGGEA